MSKAEVHLQIRQRREALNWSQKKLAAEVSKAEDLKSPLAWQTIQNWESGRTAPKRTRLATVASLLGTTVGELLGVPDDPQWASIPSLDFCLRQLTGALKLAAEEEREVLAPLLSLLAKSPDNETLIKAIVSLLEAEEH